uniref:Uncharacterized protein n=1 Tax=Thermogemmatispora argillosa TaxID=2045280 RepID=A0A455SYG8_9CHLR|nr:hypothetical protein KTA_08250 [Thermogemmatispora argillosa]
MQYRLPIQLRPEQEQLLEESGLGQPLLRARATIHTYIIFFLFGLVTATLTMLLILTFVINVVFHNFLWEDLGFWRFLLSSPLLVEISLDLWRQPFIALICGGLLLLELIGGTVSLANLLRLEVLVCTHGLLKQRAKEQQILHWQNARVLYTTRGQVTGVGGLEPEEGQGHQHQHEQSSENQEDDEDKDDASDEDASLPWPLIENGETLLSWPLSFCTNELSNHIIQKVEEYLLPLMKERLARGKSVAFLVGEKVLLVDQRGMSYEGAELIDWQELTDLRLQRGRLWLLRNGDWQRYPRRWKAFQVNLPLLVPLVRGILEERRQGGASRPGPAGQRCD